MHSRPLFFLFLCALPLGGLQAQATREPLIAELAQPRSSFSEGLRNGMSFTLMINNFGFGIGAEYRRAISPGTDLLFETHWAGLKDDTEQSFQYITGQQVIPNKYNRVMVFPVMAGVRKRVFAEQVSDNFRIHLSGQVGPSFAYAYPYYNRKQFADVPYFFIDDPTVFFPGPVPGRDPIIIPHDALSGLGEGEWVSGMAGQFTLSADFGAEFKSIQTLKIGYYAQFYPQGIQVMEPVQVLGYSESLEAYAVIEGSPKQKFFGTPVITLVLGGMW
jgi:hypothetical protein